MNLADLAKEFPRDKIHWRAQTVTRNGDRALALAYLDARDVMDRLDEVCGPENWQTEHFDCGGGRLGCRIGIIVDGHCIWKSDGAGNTDVEGEKGAFSSALKRAAVAWGIGRYLYDMPNVWVPCKAEKHGERWKFREFAADPWQYVKGGPAGDRAPRGPQGGRAKPANDQRTLILNVGKDAHSYPMGTWQDIGQYLTDLYNAVEVDAQVWDVNTNSIEKARAKLEASAPDHDAARNLLNRLLDIELMVGGGQTVQAG